ncbi:MAG: UxaA family hydrolase, partial [Aureliella sp.]
MLSPRDSVIVALQDLEPGQTVLVGQRSIPVREFIPAGHKMAVREISADTPVFKYGWSIGMASHAIAPGSHVHSHNLSCSHTIDLEAISTEVPDDLEPLVEFTFEGFQRAPSESGRPRVGTRNYLAIISNVNCSASVAKLIANRFDRTALAAYPNIDGVVSFRHGGGCAMAYEGLRHRMLSRVLGGIAKHANIGG